MKKAAKRCYASCLALPLEKRGGHLHFQVTGQEARVTMDSDRDVELECPFCGEVFAVKHYHSIGDLIYHKECGNHSILIKTTNPPNAYVLIKERRAQKRSE